jgi:hypothetical protein
MIFVPKEENSSASADGGTVREGAKLEPAYVSRGLMVDEVKLSLLDASDVAAGIRKKGVDGVFAVLVIQPASVPVSDGEVWTNHLDKM